MVSKRKRLGPGSRTSYKLPVVSGEEGRLFYNWLNKCNSINGTITEALKLKFMMDTIISSNNRELSIEDMCIDNNSNNTFKEEILI